MRHLLLPPASPGSLNCFPANAAAWDLSGKVNRWVDLGLLDIFDRIIHKGGAPSVHGLATALHSKFEDSPTSEEISFDVLKKVLSDSIMVWSAGVDGS